METPLDPMSLDPAAAAQDPLLSPQQPGLLPDRPALELDWTVPLSAERLDALGRRIVREVEHYRQATATRRSNAQMWRDDCEMMPADQEGPWDNSSAVRAPYTAIACQAHTTRLNNQIINADPPVQAKARKASAVEAAPVIQDVVAAHLEECVWAQVARDVHKELPEVGNCLVRTTWAYETRRVAVQKLTVDEEQMVNLAEAGAELDTALAASVETDQQGRAKWKVQFEDQVIQDGLELTVIPFRDAILLPVTAKKPKELWGVGEQLTLRGLDLIAGAQSGKYDKEQVGRLLERYSDSASEERQDEYSRIGVDDPAAPTSEERPEYREYECVELCWLDDLDAEDDDDPLKATLTWYVVTVHLATSLVLRCQYLPYEHGEAYYTPFRYLTRTGELLGASIAERMAVIQHAATTCINQFFDLADQLVGTVGSFWYTIGSGYKPDQQRIMPGRPIRVNAPNQIGALPIGQGIPMAMEQLLQALTLLKEWGDLLTAASNPALGRETDADKTLGEVRIAVGQGNAIFEDYAAGVALSWSRVWDQARVLLAQFSDRGQVAFRKTAAPGVMLQDGGQQVPGVMLGGQIIPAPGGTWFGTVDANLLREEVDLVPAGLNLFPDAQTRITQSTVVLDRLLEHPLTAPLPDVQLDILETWLQDLRFPRAQSMMGKIRQGQQMLQQAMAAQAMQQQQAMGQQMAMAEAQQGQQMQQADQEGRMAEESHAMDMAAKAHQMAQPAKNGVKK